jgi:hypothetical protein
LANTLLIEVGKNMDKAFAEVEKELDAKLGTFGWNKSVGPTKSVTDMLQKQGMKQVGVPLSDVREASQTREQRIQNPKKRLLARTHNVFFCTPAGVYLGLAAFTLALRFQKVRPSNYDCISSLRASTLSAYSYAPSFLPSTCGSQMALYNTLQPVHHPLCLRVR